MVERTLKEWIDNDQHGFDHNNPLYKFYYTLGLYEQTRGVYWTFGFNNDLKEFDDLRVPNFYTILTSEGAWQMVRKGTIRRIDFALRQLKKAREIGKRWRKERYYWNEEFNVRESET